MLCVYPVRSCSSFSRNFRNSILRSTFLHCVFEKTKAGFELYGEEEYQNCVCFLKWRWLLPPERGRPTTVPDLFVSPEKVMHQLMCFRFLFGFAGKATCIIKNKEITYVLNVNQPIDLFLDLTFQCKM
jgi:hypothetical protein